LSQGSNVRNLNWEDIDHSGLHGAGDVITRVQFWRKTWFLSLLFALCVGGLFGTAFFHSQLLNIRASSILLTGFSKEVGTLESLDQSIQLDLILRERVGIQDKEALVRRADSKIAYKVGSAWTAVRRASLIPQVDSALLRAAKQEADKGAALLGRRQSKFESIFNAFVFGTGILLFGTLIISIQALKRRATTLVVQSLTSGNMTGSYSDISASSSKESEAITRAVNNLPAAIIEFESDGRVLRWNDQMQALTGIPASDVLGRNVIDCVQWGSTSEAAKSTIRKVFSGESIPKLEWTVTHYLGDKMDLQAHIKPVVDGGGAVRSAAAVIRDVTSEKYGRELLVSNDVARLAIIRSLPNSLLRFDANLNLVEIHDNSQILVENIQGVRGTKWREGFGPDLAELVTKAIRQTRLTQKPFMFEYAGELAGRHVSLGFRVAVAGPTDVIAIVSDLSDRQRLLEAEGRGVARFRSLIEGSSDTVMLLSEEGIILYASPAVRSILGIGVESAIGRNWLSLIDKNSRETAEAGWRESLAGSAEFVLDLVFNDGTKTAEFTARNLLKDESVQAIVFNIRDITERRRLEIELHNRMEELEERAEALRDASKRDPLTGTLNYQALLDYLDAICEYTAGGGMFAAILFGIDDFKSLNANLGFKVGDELLCSLVNAIRAECREEDILGRAGSKGFLLILPEADLQTADRIVTSVKKQFLSETKGVAQINFGLISRRNQECNSTVVLSELSLNADEHDGSYTDSAA
jgi:diguanylate cyclase (GGDEF)-like protein/PAS domain S-box-containing protein